METNNYYENRQNKLNNHKPNPSEINWLEITENPLMYDNKGMRNILIIFMIQFMVNQMYNNYILKNN